MKNVDIVINEISALSVAHNTNEFMGRTVEILFHYYSLHFVGLHLIDWRNEVIALQAGTGSIAQELISKGWRLPITISWIGEVIQFGEVRLINYRTWDMYKYPSFDKQTEPILVLEHKGLVPGPLFPNTRWQYFLPCRLDKKVISILEIHTVNKSPYNGEIIKNFQLVADTLAEFLEGEL